MIVRLAAAGSPRQIVAGSLYGLGLLGMLSLSAGYNLAVPGRAKAILRRLDHAMIFVMIAGSYTPFALCVLAPRMGIPLLIAAWIVAFIGAALKLLLGNRFDAAFIALYLAHGWMLVAVLRPIAAAVRLDVLILLVAGGLVYSLGAVIHTRTRWPFHNPAWHALVLLAASLHLRAIVQVLGIGGA